MLIEAPQQDPTVGCPQRTEVIRRECPGHAASSHDLRYSGLQESNLLGQGNMRVVAYRHASIDEAASGLARATVDLSGDIVDDVDSAKIDGETRVDCTLGLPLSPQRHVPSCVASVCAWVPSFPPQSRDQTSHRLRPCRNLPSRAYSMARSTPRSSSPISPPPGGDVNGVLHRRSTDREAVGHHTQYHREEDA